MHRFKALVQRLNNNNYKLYKGLDFPVEYDNFTLRLDAVQPDPFAPPSKISILIPFQKAGFPQYFISSKPRSKAFRDALARVVAKNIRKMTKGNRGTGNSGVIAINYGGQKILERNSIIIENDTLVVRLVAGLPAHGRSIAAEQAIAMFCKEIPELVSESLFFHKLDEKYFYSFIHTVEKQEFIREQLPKMKLVSFIADFSILPRKSGVEDTPLSDAVKFFSPDTLRVKVDLPDGSQAMGMGVREGITLITGGGFHGKSTLLAAIQSGFYNHIPGDGREYVVSVPTLAKIRAEEGRSIAGVDISTFINNLPAGKPTENFSTENASGSTSQAANIIEAMEAGANCLLMDEDSSATNFLIRDKRMQELIPPEKEPITPFIDTARTLYQRKGVSTVIVTGGSGDYLDIADSVILMENYKAFDALERAKQICKAYPNSHINRFDGEIRTRKRVPMTGSVDASRRKRDIDIKTAEKGIEFGRDRIDLTAWEHIVDQTQYDTLGDCLAYAAKMEYFNERNGVVAILDLIEGDIRKHGIDALAKELYPEWHYGCEVRRIDIAAALNRLRSLKVK